MLVYETKRASRAMCKMNFYKFRFINWRPRILHIQYSLDWIFQYAMA